MHYNYRFAGQCASVSAVVFFSILLSAQPAVTLSPTSLSFGNQVVGTTSSAQVITLTNTGTSSLSLTTIKLSGGNRTDYSQTNTCGGSLAVNASCTISVKFTPLAIGSRTSTVSISDNAAGSPQSVPLSGTGVAPAVTLSPLSLLFSGVLVGKSSSTQTVTVSNTGTASLTVTEIDAFGDFSQTNNCTGAAIAAGSSCKITVTFSPTGTWSRDGTIVITDNAYNAPQQVVFLVGMGNSGTTASVSPSSLSYREPNAGNRQLD